MLDPTLTCEALTLSFVQSSQVACWISLNSIPRSDSKSWKLDKTSTVKTPILHRIFRLTLFVRAKHVSPESGTPDKEFYPRTYVEVKPPFSLRTSTKSLILSSYPNLNIVLEKAKAKRTQRALSSPPSTTADWMCAIRWAFPSANTPHAYALLRKLLFDEIPKCRLNEYMYVFRVCRLKMQNFSCKFIFINMGKCEGRKAIIGHFTENRQNCSGNFGQRFVSIGSSGVSSTLCHCKCGSLWLLFRLIISSLWSSGLQCFHWFSLWW